jgi:ADP-L-glycero-D-manno-heptose 6-epimerase
MIVVTGGAGFIGSAVIWRLNQEGIDDILVVDNLGRSTKWKNLVNRRYLDYVHKSVFVERLMDNHWRSISAIVHMGACSATTEQDADFLMDNNFHYSQALARYALERDIRFINASSAATYGDGSQGFRDDVARMAELRPLNMYAYSKYLFDCWALREKRLEKMVSLKFFNVFGPNEYHKGEMSSLVFKAFHQVREKGHIRLFKSYHTDYPHGGQRRDFVYVKDCAELVWWFLNNPTANGLYNVGTGQARTWNALAAAVFHAMDAKANITYFDMPDTLKKAYQYYTCADMEKLGQAGTAVTFRSLENAVEDYVVNYLQQEDRYL